MLLKTLIAILFLAMVASLIVGAGFLLRDDSHSRRLLRSLEVRVGLAIALLALILYGFLSGGFD